MNSQEPAEPGLVQITMTPQLLDVIMAYPTVPPIDFGMVKTDSNAEAMWSPR